MASKNEFADYIAELLAPHGRILIRRMFGGHGVYCDGLFIAILRGESLYLKVDESSRGEFELAGCAAFTYQRAGKTASLGFYEAPANAMESPDLIGPWARLALQAALRAEAKKRPVMKRLASQRPAAKKKR